MNHARRAALIARMKQVGVSDRLKRALAMNLEDIMDGIGRIQGDNKQRHYVMLIFTEEGNDDSGRGTMVSSDMISSMENHVAREFTNDWVEGARKMRR